MDEWEEYVGLSHRLAIKWDYPRRCRVGKQVFTVVGQWCKHTMPALVAGKEVYLPAILICINPYCEGGGFVEISPSHPRLKWIDK